MLTLTTSFLLALAVSCIFFGLAIATFILCILSLAAIPFKEFTCTRWMLFSVSCATLVIAAISVGQDIAHNLEAFVYYKGGTAAFEELADPQNPLYTIHSITYPIQAFLGDSVLVYRTWVVNSKNWRYVVVPIILVIGGTFCGFGMEYAMSKLRTGGYLDPTVTPWSSAFVAISLSLNVICTGHIIYRILNVSRSSRATGLIGPNSSLHLVLRVIIESGLIYTLTTLLCLILGNMRSMATYIVATSYLQIIPICFNLIIIRTSNRQENDAWSASAPPLPLRFRATQSVSTRQLQSNGTTFGVGAIIEHKDEMIPMGIVDTLQAPATVVTAQEKWKAIG